MGMSCSTITIETPSSARKCSMVEATASASRCAMPAVGSSRSSTRGAEPDHGHELREPAGAGAAATTPSLRLVLGAEQGARRQVEYLTADGSCHLGIGQVLTAARAAGRWVGHGRIRIRPLGKVTARITRMLAGLLP